MSLLEYKPLTSLKVAPGQKYCPSAKTIVKVVPVAVPVALLLKTAVLAA